MNVNRIILVGRHAPDFGANADYDVVYQENITWPATAEECRVPLARLHDLSMEHGAYIVFQNIPGQLAALLAHEAMRDGEMSPRRYGVIVSVPGPRPVGATSSFFVNDAWECAVLVEVAMFANPRARTERIAGPGVRITVDPPMEFKFSHIEWF